MIQPAFTAQTQNEIITITIVSEVDIQGVKELMEAVHDKLADHNVRVELKAAAPNFMLLQCLWALRVWLQEHNRQLLLSEDNPSWNQLLQLVGWTHR